MDHKKIITRFEHTLGLIDSFNLKNEPVVIRKGELFIDYGEKNTKIGLLTSGLLYASYLSDSGTDPAGTNSERHRSMLRFAESHYQSSAPRQEPIRDRSLPTRWRTPRLPSLSQPKPACLPGIHSPPTDPFPSIHRAPRN